MNDTALDAALEAALFASGSPVTLEKLCEIFELPKEDISSAVIRLSAKLNMPENGIQLVTVDDAYQLCTKPAFADSVKRALELRKTPPLTKASLEVLAIVAYNQPVTRSYIEAVRGVDSASIVASLSDKGLIYESGHLDAPGKPSVFSTTANFLRCFGLESLEGLPELKLPGETEASDVSPDATLS